MYLFRIPDAHKIHGNLDKENMLTLFFFPSFFDVQFQRYQPEDGRISERDFAEILLLYAGLTENKRIKMLKRVKKVFKEEPQVCFW